MDLGLFFVDILFFLNLMEQKTFSLRESVFFPRFTCDILILFYSNRMTIFVKI